MFFGRNAGVGGKLGIQVIEIAFRRASPDKLRQRFGELAKLVFTLAHRLLNALDRLDPSALAYHPGSLPVAVFNTPPLTASDISESRCYTTITRCQAQLAPVTSD